MACGLAGADLLLLPPARPALPGQFSIYGEATVSFSVPPPTLNTAASNLYSMVYNNPMEETMDLTLPRCNWNLNDALLTRYHDEEWGVPVHNDQILFEFISLDGMQAGLSWNTILRKRENFRTAFDHFDIATVAAYNEEKVQTLLSDTGIIRNRAKINAIIHNAGRVQEIQREFGSLDAYLWRFVDGKPVQNCWQVITDIPARTELSDQISRDMIARGFKFCGSTILYAILQSAGLVNDHVVGCFRHSQLRR